MGRALSRSLGLLAILFAFALVFWLTAVFMSSFPNTFVVAVNVHGLNLPGSGNSSERPAPLSLSVLDDARQDAGTIRTSTPTPAPTTVPSRGPVAAPSPTPVRTTPPPTPSPTATPLPLPLPTPTPTATPAPAAIAGQVIDGSTKLAIIGATISASPGGASTTTDVNGDYSLGVSAGSYTVTASAPTYNSASQTVSVKAGQQLPLNFKLTSITAYGSLSGTVTDAVTHAPIVGATVTLSDGMIRTTDLNGNFSYSIVLNGTYTLTVSALGYVTQSQLVSVKAGHTTNVQIALTH
jgi:carboxypeptidase family protein